MLEDCWKPSLSRWLVTVRFLISILARRETFLLFFFFWHYASTERQRSTIYLTILDLLHCHSATMTFYSLLCRFTSVYSNTASFHFH